MIMFGPLLEVEMSEKCTLLRRTLLRRTLLRRTLLRREAHFEVKMYKTHNIQTTFGRLRSYNDNYSYDYN